MRRFAATVFLFGLLAGDACAHAVGVDCTLRLNRIDVEVFYDDDTAAQKAKVELVNAQEEVVETAVTDKDGRCVLRKPAAGKYEVRVDAGAGHRTKKKIDVPASNVHEAGIGIALGASLHAAKTVPTPSPQEVTVGPSLVRAEFTRFPWLKLLIGFVVIGALGGAFLLSFRLRLSGRAAPRER